MKKQTYHTNGKRELIDFLSQNPDRQFTTEELCEAVNGGSTHRRSSVYRYLAALCQDDVVRKFHSEDRSCNVYQYVGENCDCSHHFHEKCLRCGGIRHLDCEGSEAFTEHLLQKHGFAVDCGQSILYGICAACRAREGAQPQ